MSGSSPKLCVTLRNVQDRPQYGSTVRASGSGSTRGLAGHCQMSNCELVHDWRVQPPFLYITNACFILGRCNTYLLLSLVVVVAATRTVPSKCTFLSYRPRGYPEATRSAAIKICRWPSLHPRCRARRRGSVSVAVPLLLLLLCWTPPWSPRSRRQLCSCRWVPQPTP